MKLKEEIERIKSLFTEERLFGNLVEVDNPDKNMDKKIDSDELEDAGGEIGIKQAKEFIRKSGKVTVLDVEDCDVTVESVPHLKCVKDALDDSDFKDMYQLFHQSLTIGCTFQITRVNRILDFEKLSDAITGDYTSSNTKLTITFWERGKYQGEKKTFAIFMEFSTPLTKIEGIGGKTHNNVDWFRLRGSIDDSCNVTNVWMDQIHERTNGTDNLKKQKKIYY
jgi:hypothetical protein